MPSASHTPGRVCSGCRLGLRDDDDDDDDDDDERPDEEDDDDDDDSSPVRIRAEGGRDRGGK